MEIGDLLLLFSLTATSFSALLFLLVLKNRDFKLAPLAETLIHASTSACFAALALLFYYFISDNFSVWYVYANSNLEMPLMYKLSAVWAGEEGSLLLWAFYTLLITSIYLTGGKKDMVKVKAGLLMSAFASFLLILLTFSSSPFVTIPYMPSNGYGLNPLLRTFEMVIHPPIIFFAYSLSALLFSITLAKDTDQMIARLTWLFLSMGIIVGGWWAYRTLGWGGFWGWDPVENSSLMPWVTLTLYFHTRRHKEIFAYLTFTLVIFAAFIARSGVISSLHSFGSDYFAFLYFIPMSSSLIPVVLRIRDFENLKSFCSPLLPVLFYSALIVVFLGTIANLIFEVDRIYYTITFLPIFAMITVLVVLKIGGMNAALKVIHIGLIALFIGSASVWLLETHKVLKVESGASGEFSLIDVWLNEDEEKFTVVSEIKTPYGLVHPKYFIYKVEREERGVASVELISYPWCDEYFALKDFNLQNKTVILEHYTVPLISFVWLGSILIMVGMVLRQSSKINGKLVNYLSTRRQ